MFAAEFEAVQMETRRRSKRVPISLDASVGKTGRTLCKVIDLSSHGVRLATFSSMKRGSMVWLMLPEIGHVAIHVRWSDDFSAGCEFDKPLEQGVVDRLLAIAEGNSQS